MNSKIEILIKGRPRDLGGFGVRRVLPFASRRTVGPFIFLDHMGPADFPPDQGIDVMPHPHIGLATVTYLFEGAFLHRDSLGSEQLIEPGAVNWMIAGRGIVHSERTPLVLRERGSRLHGVQCWVALPEEFEELDPHFSHHPSATLPEFTIDGAHLKLLLGTAFGHQSLVPVHSDLFYLHVTLPQGARLELPSDVRECGAYVVDGKVQIDDEMVAEGQLAVLRPSHTHALVALAPTRLMLLGGQPIGKREIWWNLVSSSPERLEAAKQEWLSIGPSENSNRFRPIPDDDREYVPGPAK